MNESIVRPAEESDKGAIINCLLEGFLPDFLPFIKLYGYEEVRMFMGKTLQIKRFFVAELDGKLVGVLCLSDHQGRAMTGARQLAKESFNWLKGRLVSWGLEDYDQPLKFDPSVGFIEFVAVDSGYRKQGIASRMIKNIVATSPYKTYILDVKDINKEAITLYEKLGFKEIGRKKAGFNFEKGFREKIYMKLEL